MGIKIIRLLGAIILCAGTVAFVAMDLEWKIADNYEVRFSGKKAGGTFTGLKGTILFDERNLGACKIDVSVDAATIKTGNATKDKHARGEAWFHVSKYPQIKFSSTQFSRQGGFFIVTGDLTLHGITKTVSILFQFQRTGSNATFNGSFKVNRRDFGIKGNSLEFLVGNEFTIDIKVPVTIRQ